MLTHETAIEVLTTIEGEVKFCDSVYLEGEVGGGNLLEAINVAIASLKKQVPKKPIHNGDYHCPSCGRYIEKGHRCHHNDCGQAIDWSEE